VDVGLAEWLHGGERGSLPAAMAACASETALRRHALAGATSSPGEDAMSPPMGDSKRSFVGDATSCVPAAALAEQVGETVQTQRREIQTYRRLYDA
jgi:hypothetical protein